jgi:hypothetical protein
VFKPEDVQTYDERREYMETLLMGAEIYYQEHYADDKRTV